MKKSGGVIVKLVLVIASTLPEKGVQIIVGRVSAEVS